MIVTSAPLRISFAGGGSDLPAFYQYEPGVVVSAAIDLRVHVLLNDHRPFAGNIRVVYSEVETVRTIEALRHEIARACLIRYDEGQKCEVVSVGDIPSGNGLGSSSAYAVALLSALKDARGSDEDEGDLGALAEEAYTIERDYCGRFIGKQDAYASAFGGLSRYTFKADGTVSVQSMSSVEGLERHLLLLDTNTWRDANAVLKFQTTTVDPIDSRDRASVRAMANLASELWDRWVAGDMDATGPILNAGWALKRGRVGVTSPQIDEWHRQINKAAQSSSAGAKLCGAGGGGCFLVYAPPERHEAIVAATGLRSYHPQISWHGVVAVELR